MFVLDGWDHLSGQTSLSLYQTISQPSDEKREEYCFLPTTAPKTEAYLKKAYMGIEISEDKMLLSSRSHPGVAEGKPSQERESCYVVGTPNRYSRFFRMQAFP